jgi:thiol-disulfide isomerase/thioredoxin
MPDLAPGEWLNTQVPLTKRQLHGQVVLVDFWDYSCLHCIRTFPYLTSWYERYADKGLTIIGVHTPEFGFGRIRTQVEAAAERHGLRYPILLDNEYETWSRFANKAWPSKHLVDAHGYIRLRRQGEGHYLELERAMQILLRQRHDGVTLPDPLRPIRQEDEPGAVCYRPTPELYAGYRGGGLFGGALGNPAGYVPQNPMFYELPESLEEGQFFLEGAWRAWPEAMAYAGRQGGKILLPYSATGVSAVLSPSADQVEVALALRVTGADPIVVVMQDGRFLDSHSAGQDVRFREDGTSYLEIARPRMYHIVQNMAFGRHELELTFQATGIALYAFTFSSCVAPVGKRYGPGTIRMP